MLEIKYFMLEADTPEMCTTCAWEATTKCLHVTVKTGVGSTGHVSRCLTEDAVLNWDVAETRADN